MKGADSVSTDRGQIPWQDQSNSLGYPTMPKCTLAPPKAPAFMNQRAELSQRLHRSPSSQQQYDSPIRITFPSSAKKQLLQDKGGPQINLLSPKEQPICALLSDA